MLSGFAIAQPLLDITGNSPDFFLFRRADRFDIVALVLGVLLLPASFVGPRGRGGSGWSRTRSGASSYLAAIGGLFTLLAIEVAKKLTDLRGPLLVVIALAGGLLAVVVYVSSRG